MGIYAPNHQTTPSSKPSLAFRWCENPETAPTLNPAQLFPASNTTPFMQTELPCGQFANRRLILDLRSRPDSSLRINWSSSLRSAIAGGVHAADNYLPAPLKAKTWSRVPIIRRDRASADMAATGGLAQHVRPLRLSKNLSWSALRPVCNYPAPALRAKLMEPRRKGVRIGRGWFCWHGTPLVTQLTYRVRELLALSASAVPRIASVILGHNAFR